MLQITREAVALDLGAGKHDGLVDAGITQPVVQQLALVLGVVGPEQALLDVDVLFLRVVDSDALHFRAVVVHHAHGELLNARRKCGREHHGLAALAGELVDFREIVRKAQVEHAVGFVHHQKLHLVEFDLHGALQVEQTTWGRYDEVGVLQFGNLQLVGHATDDVGNADTAAMLDQVDGVMCYLLGKFACRAHDQGAGHGSLEVARVGRVLALGALGSSFTLRSGVGHSALVLFTLLEFGLGLLLDEGMQHGQQECSGLAGTGLAGNHQVHEAAFSGKLAGQCQRNGFFLYHGRLDIAKVLYRLHQRGSQPQFDEAVGGIVFHHRLNSGGLVVVHRDFGRREVASHLHSVSHIFSRT